MQQEHQSSDHPRIFLRSGPDSQGCGPRVRFKTVDASAHDLRMATHSLRVVCASSAHRVRIVSEQSGNSAFGAMPGILVFSCPGFGRVLARMLRVLLSHVTDSTGSQQEETILRLGCAAYLQLVVDCRVLWLHPYA